MISEREKLIRDTWEKVRGKAERYLLESRRFAYLLEDPQRLVRSFENDEIRYEKPDVIDFVHITRFDRYLGLKIDAIVCEGIELEWHVTEPKP